MATVSTRRKMRSACLMYMLVAGVLFSSFLSLSSAAAPCTSDEMCQSLYSSSASFCLPDKQTCSNPFQQGCLKKMNVSRYVDRLRICNSNDDLANATKLSDEENSTFSALCTVSEFPYLEIRIHQGDWESSYFLAWIYQIVLMELVGVPATVGLTTEMTKVTDFYSPENELQFSPFPYSPEGLIKSNQVASCNEVEEECVHVLPEVWDGQYDIYQKLLEDGEIDRPLSNGMLDQTSLYVPLFTARNHPSLTSFLGYQGEDNRALLAELFKRPTTWQDYCETVSENNCTIPNDIASGYPGTETERGQYFVQDGYSGHFEATLTSNCSQVDDCAGYIVGPPCDLTTNLNAQLYWNNITGLRRDGPVSPDGAYSTTSMKEIWLAANATKSDVIMWWYSVNEIQQLFEYTESEFQQVLLPKPTALCLAHRTSNQDRCNADAVIRRGDERGACDDEPQALQKVIAASLVDSNNGLDEADRSPGYEVAMNLKINSFDMSQIIRRWVTKGIDQNGNDAREAVCEWVVENLETLENYVPPGFPREVFERDGTEWYTIFAQVVAVLTAVATLAAIALVSRYSRTKVMVFAQPLFLFLVLSGFLLISFAAFVMVVQPTDFLCIFVEWLVVLGYSIALVPVLVKTAAINRLTNSSKKTQRVRLSPQTLFSRVVVAVVIVLACLIFWTYQDPPSAVYAQELSKDDPKLVTRDLECESQSIVWTAVQLSWEVVLLLMAAVLAFQSRRAASVVNDSRSLGIMVYSHVVFVGIRGCLVFLDETNAVKGSIVVALFSFNYSLDALLALLVYVYPKIYLAYIEPGNYFSGIGGTSTRFKASASTRRMTSSKRASSNDASRLDSISERPKLEDKGELKILLCTGNLGNAEPTTESLMAWVPPDGSCKKVTPLVGTKPLTGKFDLIVIGMQESTWKPSSDVLKDSVRSVTNDDGDDISESDILRAMEAHDTATLRQMVRDILGEDYAEVAEESRGQMRLHVWAAESVIDDIDEIKISGANTGVGNVLANKGGIVITLDYKNTQLSFLSAHLAAHEGQSYYNHRCRNIRSIFKEAKTSVLSSKLDISMSSDHVFVMGDLNFRTNFGTDGEHEDHVNRALQMIEDKDYAKLYSYDELHKGIDAGDLLVGFETLPCLFPPTFKVEREPGYSYKRQRTPSYTDRILFNSLPSLEAQLKPLAYEPCEDFATSDHKPIRGAFSIIPNSNVRPYAVENETTLVFRNFACMDLPAADSNGLADPYIMIMWEKDALEEVNINFTAKLRKFFLGTTRWPRTSYQPKTLNPEWKGEDIVIRTKNGDVAPGTKLFLVLVDYDALSKDDYMCTTRLDLSELMKMRHDEREKRIPIYRHLQRHGRNSGRIKFHVDVRRENMQRRKSFFYRPSHFPVEASQYDLSDGSFKSYSEATL
eukprot:scaffold2156_cov115-Cylindrotheca_fusiformis.AAC.2